MTKFLRAIEKADQYIDAEPEAAKQSVAKRLSIQVSDINKLWGEFVFGLSIEQLLLVTLEAEARWAMQKGFVKSDTIPNYLALFNQAPLNQVRPEAITVIQ